MDSLPAPLSGKYEKSFAYETIKDRLPNIVTKVVDFLARHRTAMAEKFGNEAEIEWKSCIGAMDKLRYELARDKPILLLTDNHSEDVQLWNDCLQKEIDSGKRLSWFQSSWLLSECFLYRKVMETFFLTNYFQQIDPFAEMKQNTFHSSAKAIDILLDQLNADIDENNNPAENRSVIENQLKIYLEIALWGNACDLSLSSGDNRSQEHDPFHQIAELQSKILINDEKSVFDYLYEQQAFLLNFEVSIDLILDNAGFELLTDLCLADFLVSKRLCSKINLHFKSMPWFVSDATKSDFHWILEQMNDLSSNQSRKTAAARWQEHVKDGLWTIQTHPFYTLPYDYAQMREISPELYCSLSQSKLLIFKGDLNYRKLVGDLQWPFHETFQTALRGFQPSPLVSLRTLKADVQVGLNENLVKKVSETDPRWMVNGRWAIIQADLKQE